MWFNFPTHVISYEISLSIRHDLLSCLCQANQNIMLLFDVTYQTQWLWHQWNYWLLSILHSQRLEVAITQSIYERSPKAFVINWHKAFVVFQENNLEYKLCYLNHPSRILCIMYIYVHKCVLIDLVMFFFYLFVDVNYSCHWFLT